MHRQTHDRPTGQNTTTKVDPGALFTMTADGVAFEAPELFAEPPPAEACQHVPGVVFAPVFGLPGSHSSTCERCGAGITRAGRGEPWTA